MTSLGLATISFGGVFAIVTSLGMIIGFGAAGTAKATIIAGLLIVGFADNLTDSLSIHIYQESENLEQRAAFRATVGNFFTRLLVSLSFVTLVLSLSGERVVIASLVWGALLLTGLTWFVAKSRKTNAVTEILKHLGIAVVVIGVSLATGTLINEYVQ